MSDWFLYVVECSDGSLYTGITKNISRRVHEHNNTGRGAKYTRARRPVKLVYSVGCNDRSSAGKAEAKFKKLSRREKLEVVNESN